MIGSRAKGLVPCAAAALLALAGCGGGGGASGGGSDGGTGAGGPDGAAGVRSEGVPGVGAALPGIEVANAVAPGPIPPEEAFRLVTQGTYGATLEDI